jgi:hypothetical protein
MSTDKVANEALRNEINSEADKFDKAILTLSSAALGLTFSFNKIFGPISFACSVCFIILAWLCFIASISTTLFSFLYSQNLRLRELDEIADPKKTDKTIEYCNVISAIAFLLGIIFTFIFSLISILH